MKYQFIKHNEDDNYYYSAVQLRIEQFFKGHPNPTDLINDQFEKTGTHLICLLNDSVIGTGRLNIENHQGIISQMAIDSQYQNKGIGKTILEQLINQCKEHNVNEIVLNARETAINFYKKYGFKITSEKFPSKKTGIIHQSMSLLL